MRQTFNWIVLLVSAASTGYSQKLIDEKATAETQALYQNLAELSKKGFLFGHQDGDAYGVNWKAEEGRSDVKEVCGSYPAIHGWDVGRLEIGKETNLDNVNFTKMLGWIKSNYERGGINTISWHMDNPVSKKDSWDKTPAVSEILPEGSHHQYYVEQLDRLADFFLKCKSGQVYIPIIFRPFHEHNGDWFWWGKGHASEEEYIKLWKFTVDYLKDTKGIHHLIYAFSPDRSRLSLDNFKLSYLYAYPGDDYVDILGLDNYMDVGVKWNKLTPEEQREGFIKSMTGLSLLAEEKKKIAALTETGLEAMTNHKWFTEVILHPIKENPAIKIAYVMVWRNDNPGHCYAPYPGHPVVPDFMSFYDDEMTFFESDLKDIYKVKRKLKR